jgi:hypothetical protein
MISIYFFNLSSLLNCEFQAKKMQKQVFTFVCAILNTNQQQNPDIWIDVIFPVLSSSLPNWIHQPSLWVKTDYHSLPQKVNQKLRGLKKLLQCHRGTRPLSRLSFRWMPVLDNNYSSHWIFLNFIEMYGSPICNSHLFNTPCEWVGALK